MKIAGAVVACLMVGQLIACTTKSSSDAISNDTATLTSEVGRSAAEEKEIIALLRDMYKWKESADPDGNDFPLSVTDTTQPGLDAHAFAERVRVLKATGFFSKGFLKAYTEIATRIDKGLKDGTFVFVAGELPPYGPDADPWYNSHDYEYEFWKTLPLNNLVLQQDTASLSWSWSKSSGFAAHSYKVKCIKENGKWQILYLEGFDTKNYFPSNN